MSLTAPRLSGRAPRLSGRAPAAKAPQAQPLAVPRAWNATSVQCPYCRRNFNARVLEDHKLRSCTERPEKVQERERRQLNARAKQATTFQATTFQTTTFRRQTPAPARRTVQPAPRYSTQPRAAPLPRATASARAAPRPPTPPLRRGPAPGFVFTAAPPEPQWAEPPVPAPRFSTRGAAPPRPTLGERRMERDMQKLKDQAKQAEKRRREEEEEEEGGSPGAEWRPKPRLTLAQRRAEVKRQKLDNAAVAAGAAAAADAVEPAAPPPRPLPLTSPPAGGAAEVAVPPRPPPLTPEAGRGGAHAPPPPAVPRREEGSLSSVNAETSSPPPREEEKGGCVAAKGGSPAGGSGGGDDAECPLATCCDFLLRTGDPGACEAVTAAARAVRGGWLDGGRAWASHDDVAKACHAAIQDITGTVPVQMSLLEAVTELLTAIKQWESGGSSPTSER